jgi:hypothetical protein
MSQRRNSNSSGRGDERSDLTDIKAMAAKARSETGRHVLPQNPAELSGVRPRRDSVVGMRLTPPPRTTVTSELPNWFWGALGCLSVLLVGFAGLFLLGRSGKLDNVLGARSGAASSASATAPVAPVAVAPIAPSVEPVPAADNAAPTPAEPAPTHHSHAASAEERERVAREAPAPVADNGAPAAAAPAADNTAPAPDQPPPSAADNAPAPKQPTADDQAPTQAAAQAPAAANPAQTKNADQPAAADDTPAKAPRAARATSTPKAAPAADDSDDDQSAPGQDDVEAALDKLASRMRGCFAKYGIKGTARVRLVATPDGTADNVKVTGEFEDTPTGLCVESILTDTKLPTFKGPPLKISQSYQFR